MSQTGNRYTGEQTREETTVRTYLERAKAIGRQVQEDLAIPDEIPHPIDIAEWLIDKKPTITHGTFRQYKAALICAWEDHASEPGYQDAFPLLQSTTSEGCLKSGHGRTSSGKPKYIPEQDFRLMVNHLKERRSDWAHRTAIFMEATLVAGLRPTEWRDARLAGRGLVVKNAKATNGRANGVYRPVPVPDPAMPDPTAMPSVRAHMDAVKEWITQPGNTWDAYHHRCRTALWETVQALWGGRAGKSYTLYSCRHQFSANIKNIHPEEIVAKLMGHASINTAQEDYGKRRNGWQKFKDARRQKLDHTPKFTPRSSSATDVPE